MIKRIAKKIWNSESNENIKTPINQTCSFVLTYKNLTIGTLSLDEGIWKFEYSIDFKNQNEIIPIIDFPNKDLVYKNEQLWPFFSYRIPGLNQPSVQEIIKDEEIDKNNEAELLKKFGKFSIFNPFKLNPVF